MGTRVYIGADGGGTKTALAAWAEGRVLPSKEGAGINYNLTGPAKAAENFAEAVRKLALPEDAEIAGIAIGDPAVDDLAASPMTEEFLSLVRKFLSLPPNCPIHARSDLYMTLYGMTEGGAGALMVSGTGSMGMAVDRAGGLHVVGGWGRLTEDEGSGYYIAVNGIKAALRCFDGTGPKTVLLEDMRRYFGMEDPRTFILAYYADREAFPDVAGFAAVVGRRACSDGEAEKILRACADRLTDGMLALLKKADLDACRIGIYGSVLLKNEFVRERFGRGVQRAHPEAEIVVPAVEPQMAALRYSMMHGRQGGESGNECGREIF